MLHDLYTPQGQALTGTPWQSYPRPRMKREGWMNLNGEWEFAVSAQDSLPAQYDRKIRVPFCPESLLSGLKLSITPGSFLFYRRALVLPPQCQGQVLLHIGAADQIADIYVNQKHVGSHVGGYHAFTLDITDALAEENELVIRVTDDLRDQTLPYGKQTLHRGGMWYTPVSGIWQTVWLEWVPENAIESLSVRTDGRSATLTVSPALSGTVTLEGRQYALLDGKAVLTPAEPRFWSPEDPHLYPFTVQTATDRVESYFALRTVETKMFGGKARLCLNGKPYFFHGLLDQGYWSDGIYTPASEECFTQDILQMKALGFNVLRKHIKVEPELFYYACDKLGMIVFQDMVNNGDYSFLRDTALPTVGIQKLPDRHLHKNPATREAFLREMEATVAQLKNHPCILYWTVFNEGWGQFDSDRVYDRLRALDDTRIIDTTSGWFRQQKSDVDSRHLYFGSWKQLRADGQKPLVLSEFGGYCYPVENHLFHPEKAYGYKSCKTLDQFQSALRALYLEKVVPAVREGLCAAIITQVSDVEDEINGFLTYDRQVCKADPETMQAIAAALKGALEDACRESLSTGK